MARRSASLRTAWSSATLSSQSGYQMPLASWLRVCVVEPLGRDQYDVEVALG